MSVERLNFGTTRRTDRPEIRLRVERDPSSADWMVTEYRRSLANVEPSRATLFRGTHSDAVRYADLYVNG